MAGVIYWKLVVTIRRSAGKAGVVGEVSALDREGQSPRV